MTSDDKPVDSARMSAEEWVDAPSDTISLRHTGGEPIDTKDLKINVQINGTNYVYSSSNISENLGGKGVWEMADVIQINTSQAWKVGIANEKDVDVKLIDTASKEVLPKYRIDFFNEFSSISSEDPDPDDPDPDDPDPKDPDPKDPDPDDPDPNDPDPDDPDPDDPVDFDIIDDTVIPKETFISSFKVLGAAFQGTDNHKYYDRMVTSRLKVGNKTFDPWGDYNLAVKSNLNGRVTNSWSLPATYPAGTPVTVIGRGWDRKSSSDKNHLDYNLDSSWEMTKEVSYESNSNKLMVLRNGYSVPENPGSFDQDSIADFVAEYVDENGKIVLEENEAIFLFELGSSNDYQDLVVLMTIDPAPAS